MQLMPLAALVTLHSCIIALLHYVLALRSAFCITFLRSCIFAFCVYVSALLRFAFCVFAFQAALYAANIMMAGGRQAG